MDWKPFIHTDAAVCGGRPIIKGPRVTVEMILEDLAHGATAQDCSLDPEPESEPVELRIAGAGTEFDDPEPREVFML